MASLSESGIQLALRALLSSPQFLFRVESGQDGASPTNPLPDNDFALGLAALVFPLEQYARRGTFRLAATRCTPSDETLRAQVKRMLQDPKSRALAENFASQWLQTRKLKEFTPTRSCSRNSTSR